MKKLRVVVSGYGRMGTEIVHLIQKSKDLVLVAMVDRGLHLIDTPCVNDFNRLNPKDVDVVIDFSSPELFVNGLQWCKKHRRPLVSGTTGLRASDQRLVVAASKVTSVLWAPNMSLGIAFIQSILKTFGRLEDFDFQIEETHHNKKKDRPSGTALLLQESLSKAVSSKLPDPISIRGGGVFGNHRVLALGAEETIIVEHNALNRTVFARGAIRAARWLAKKKPGVYSMEHLFEEA